MDFITDYDKCYKGNYKKENITYSGSNINAICFGSRKNNLIYCRIYNKTLELQETNQKHWFKEIWKNAHLDVTNVWNLEFEIKSEFLRSKNLITVNDIYYHLQDLWRFCTEKWLLKVIPNKTRISRCNISPNWQEIQNAFNSFSSLGLIDKELINENNANILIPTIAGYITSYSANKNITNIKTALSLFEKDSKKYFKAKNTTFENVVIQKINTKGGNKNE
jgi:hypothetical protein